MSSRAAPLFRTPEDLLRNAAVLGWTSLAWLSSFALMGSQNAAWNVLGVLLCVHAMVLASYLVHEAAHYNLFAAARWNRRCGEWMGFIAGASYASFDRIRHLHLRHHRDRADLTCFDFKGLMRRRPGLQRTLQALEWAYLPATEVLMHLQVLWRPFLEADQAQYRTRVLAMLLLRGSLLAGLASVSPRILPLYALAYLLLLHILNFFDAFHHTFEQFFVKEHEPVALDNRDRHYEETNTYSNLVSVRWPVLNLLTLNFGYHNAHHARAAVPWHRLPAVHRELYGTQALAVMPLSELLRTWHRNRVRRVASDQYGAPGAGHGRADQFIGAHGVSFLTVI